MAGGAAGIADASEIPSIPKMPSKRAARRNKVAGTEANVDTASLASKEVEAYSLES